METREQYVKSVNNLNIVLVFLLWTLKRFHTFFWCFHCWHWTSKWWWEVAVPQHYQYLEKQKFCLLLLNFVKWTTLLMSHMRISKFWKSFSCPYRSISHIDDYIARKLVFSERDLPLESILPTVGALNQHILSAFKARRWS